MALTGPYRTKGATGPLLSIGYREAMQELAPQDLTGPLIKAARALARMSAAELANETTLGDRTIKRAEACKGRVTLTKANVQRIVEVFRQRGILFLKDEHGVGLRVLDPLRDLS